VYHISDARFARGRAVTTESRRLCLSHVWWRGKESTECQLPPRLSRARPRLVPNQLLAIPLPTTHTFFSLSGILLIAFIL